MADDTSREPQPAPAPAPAPVPPPAEALDTGYTPGGVPTFESVREKIENRYGTSIGAAELDAETPEGRAADEQYEERQRAAAERLAQIREAMREEHGGNR
ncbi:hypothetical protein JRC04_24575 [Mycolicibacterium sp. S2-37]|uniref:hypothetical protein n=1 Tax=Mycolicibacterium sp. S2-37 TaxID=2810297 RepID=UPI001A93B644|nr:hypothetical protein [Mycolicibacterium sp. S2-37]MBO0680653.1 hypothetical protein [Mycolicibacterium sp. S2-37]